MLQQVAHQTIPVVTEDKYLNQQGTYYIFGKQETLVLKLSLNTVFILGLRCTRCASNMRKPPSQVSARLTVASHQRLVKERKHFDDRTSGVWSKNGGARRID